MSDTMLLGVLRMPFDLAMATPTSRIQYHQRGVQAADEIEKMSAEIARLHKAHQVACEGGDLLRATLLAEVERLHKAHEAACRGGEWLLAEKVSLRARMCREISDLRAENARLRAQVSEYFREPDTHPVEREE